MSEVTSSISFQGTIAIHRRHQRRLLSGHELVHELSLYMEAYCPSLTARIRFLLLLFPLLVPHDFYTTRQSRLAMTRPMA